MQIGIIGLGRMGGNITRRLIQNGHETVVYDHEPKAVVDLERDGAAGADGLEKLVQQLRPPRAVWVMLPAGKITDDTIAELGKLLSSGDVVIDGGNTFCVTISVARRCSRNAASIMSMSVPAAAFGAWSAAIA